MKKLCLIIPLCLIPTFLLAADGVDGCHITTGATSQSRLYHTPYTLGLGSPYEWIQTTSGSGGYNLVTTTKCFENSAIACKVYDYGTTGGSPPASAVVYSGFYAVVTTNCPLDDYMPLFFIFTAGVALFQIRKRNMRFVNENINHHGRF